MAALTTAGPPVTQQQPHQFVRANGVEESKRRMLNDAGEILDAGFAIDGFVISAHGHRRATRGGRDAR